MPTSSGAGSLSAEDCGLYLGRGSWLSQTLGLSTSRYRGRAAWGTAGVLGVGAHAGGVQAGRAIRSLCQGPRSILAGLAPCWGISALILPGLSGQEGPGQGDRRQGALFLASVSTSGAWVRGAQEVQPRERRGPAEGGGGQPGRRSISRTPSPAGSLCCCHRGSAAQRRLGRGAPGRCGCAPVQGERCPAAPVGSSTEADTTS